MAQFPKYKRQVSARGMQAPFQQKQVNTDYAKSLQSMGTQLQHTGQTLASIDEKVTEIERSRKYTDALVKAEQSNNKFTLMHLEDQNQANSKGYQDGHREEINSLIAAEPDKVVRDKLSASLLPSVEKTIFSMQKLDIERNNDRVEDNADLLENEYVAASDTNNIVSILNSKEKFISALTELKDSGRITEERFMQRVWEADKASAARTIDNAIHRNQEEATNMLEDLGEYFNDVEKAGYTKKINDAKTAAEYQMEVEIEQAKNSLIAQGMQEFNAGTLTLPRINAMSNANPLMKEFKIDEKLSQLVTMKAANEGTLDPRAHMNVLAELYDITGTKIDSKGKKSNKIGKMGKKEYRKVFKLQSQFLDLQLAGKVTPEQRELVGKEFEKALSDNPNFIRQFGYMQTVMNAAEDWASKTHANVQGVSTVAFNADELATGLINDIIPYVKENMNEIAINNLLYERMMEHNKTIATYSGYDISVRDGKEYVALNGEQLEITGYSNGEPMVDTQAIEDMSKFLERLESSRIDKVGLEKGDKDKFKEYTQQRGQGPFGLNIANEPESRNR